MTNNSFNLDPLDELPIVPGTSDDAIDVESGAVISPRDKLLSLRNMVVEAEDAGKVHDLMAYLHEVAAWEPELVKQIYSELFKKDPLIVHMALSFVKPSEASRAFVKEASKSDDISLKRLAYKRLAEFPPEEL